jgi:hypothetical protein
MLACDTALTAAVSTGLLLLLLLLLPLLLLPNATCLRLLVRLLTAASATLLMSASGSCMSPFTNGSSLLVTCAK